MHGCLKLRCEAGSARCAGWHSYVLCPCCDLGQCIYIVACARGVGFLMMSRKAQGARHKVRGLAFHTCRARVVALDIQTVACGRLPYSFEWIEP